jgi:hypothetical protein
VSHSLSIYRGVNIPYPLVTFYEGKGTAPVSLIGKIPEVIVSILPSKGEKTMETAMIQTTEFETKQTTDPREAKLREIIEKGKGSLHKTLEDIQHEFSIREDMAVRLTAIDFLVQDHKIQPVIRDEAYDLTDHSQSQMLTRAGIPAQFAQKLMDLEENELLYRNLKRLTERMEDGGVLLRRVGTTIKDGYLLPTKGWMPPRSWRPS